MAVLRGEVTQYTVSLHGLGGGALLPVVRLDVDPAAGSGTFVVNRVGLTFGGTPPTDNIRFGAGALIGGTAVDVALVADAFDPVIHLLQTEHPVFVSVSEIEGFQPRRDFSLSTRLEPVGEGDADADAHGEPPPEPPPPFRPTPDPPPFR